MFGHSSARDRRTHNHLTSAGGSLGIYVQTNSEGSTEGGSVWKGYRHEIDSKYIYQKRRRSGICQLCT